MQKPTCTNTRIRSRQDAHQILVAVLTGVLPYLTRRLNEDEKLSIRPGYVYAWEECNQTPYAMQRFTDGKKWHPSRIRDVSSNVAYRKAQPLI
jgi:hypothetical protein